MIGAKEVMKRVSPSQAALLWLLRSERDIPIQNLYRKLHNTPRDARHQQQLVGAVISRLNLALAPLGYVVRPGDKRRTYRLRPIQPKG